MLDLIQKAHVTLKTFKRDEDGAAIVEYGVALLIVVTIGIGVFATIGGTLDNIFGDVNQELLDSDPTTQ